MNGNWQSEFHQRRKRPLKIMPNEMSDIRGGERKGESEPDLKEQEVQNRGSACFITEKKTSVWLH